MIDTVVNLNSQVDKAVAARPKLERTMGKCKCSNFCRFVFRPRALASKANAAVGRGIRSSRENRPMNSLLRGRKKNLWSDVQFASGCFTDLRLRISTFVRRNCENSLIACFSFSVNALDKFMDPEYADSLTLSRAAKAEIILSGQLLLVDSVKRYRVLYLVPWTVFQVQQEIFLCFKWKADFNLDCPVDFGSYSILLQKRKNWRSKRKICRRCKVWWKFYPVNT